MKGQLVGRKLALLHVKQRYLVLREHGYRLGEELGHARVLETRLLLEIEGSGLHLSVNEMPVKIWDLLKV